MSVCPSGSESRGYAFVARQFAAHQGGVLAGFEVSVLRDLLYALKCLKLVDSVFMLTEANKKLNVEKVLSKKRPCVVLMGDVLSEAEFGALLTWPRVMVLVHTQYILSLPLPYLNTLMVLLWNMRYRVDVPGVAFRCRVVHQFMRQKRVVLLTEGPLFMNAYTNFCASVNFQRWVPFGYTVTRLQRRFRRRQHCAIVLQRAIKKWLYSPNMCLGQRIVHRLKCECK
jgi:hypothetical protein